MQGHRRARVKNSDAIDECRGSVCPGNERNSANAAATFTRSQFRRSNDDTRGIGPDAIAFVVHE
jgi:hypothetical protein